VGRAGGIPSRLVYETNLPARGNRKVSNDLNQENNPKHKPSMNPPRITAYLKPSCGWSQGVRAALQKYNLRYEDRDIINNPSLHAEMVEKSGQQLSPCVEVNGHMLADVSGDEVEAYLLKAGLVQPTTAVVADAPTNQACDAHHHE
jgi:monothiol glutaredoxin